MLCDRFSMCFSFFQRASFQSFSSNNIAPFKVCSLLSFFSAIGAANSQGNKYYFLLKKINRTLIIDAEK